MINTSDGEEEEEEISEEEEDQSNQLFIDLGDAHKKPMQWVIKNLLPVGLTIMGAPPKSYKSTVVMAMVASVTDLDPRVFPQDLCEVHHNGRAMVFSYEADEGDLRTMMEEGIHVKVPPDGRILVATNPWHWRLDDPESMDELIAVLIKEQPLIVVMDTFRDMHDLEEKDSGSMIKLLRPIREWAVKSLASVIMVHHTVKPSEETTTYEAKHLRGSGAIFGKADGVLMLTPQIDGKVVLKAVFKKAKGWERTLMLGLHDASATGEPLTAREVQVLNGLGNKLNYEVMSNQLKVSKGVIAECVRKLIRNGYLTKSSNTLKLTGKEMMR